MTQNVLQIPTAAPLSGMALVTDVNNALAGLASLCSGGSAPTASSLGLASTAGLLWHDTQANQLKLRNQADSAWIVLGSVNETSGIFVPAAAQVYSPLSAATTLALANGGQFLLCSAALPLTLPATSGLTSAWSVSIFAKGGPVSLSLANGSDALNGSVGGSAIVPKGYYAELVTDAAGNYSAVVIPASLGLSVLASAATVDLGTAASQVVSISGTTSITSFGASAPAGTIYTLQFAASLTLTYNAASLILPGAANLTTSANDCAQVLSLGSGNWICIDYQRASGQPVAGALGSSPAVRQTVLNGVANSSGQANFINTGSALRPGLSATSATLLLAFAAGYGSGGAIDYVEQIAADSATFFPTLTANVLSYLYATRVSAGTVTGGATLAPVQYGPSYNQAAQSSLTLNNVATDDFGNAWTNNGVTFTNSSPMLTGTYMGVFNGSSTYLKNTSITSYQSFGNGGFALRAFFKTSSLSAYQTIFSAVNNSYYGVNLIVSTAGKLELALSSTGSSWDICSITGSTTLAINTAYFIELTYDPIAGKYYVYVNGTPDSGLTVTSTSKICAVTQSYVGVTFSTTLEYYWNGNIQGFEFLPYCQHPAGATYSVPTSLASITTAGYASDWFDTVNMVMRTPSAASSVAGNNPTFTTSNKLYLGEAAAGASAISSVVSYAFQGEYAPPWTVGLPGTSTLVTAADNIGTTNKDIRVELMCVSNDNGYVPGDVLTGFITNSSSGGYSFPTISNRNSSAFATGNTGAFQVTTKSGSGWCTLTAANWAYRITASRKKGY